MSVTNQRKLMKRVRSAFRMKVSSDIDAAEWYSVHGINEGDVCDMLRSKCRSLRHFPKRKPRDIYINHFEPNLHSDYVQSNMDIQAIMSTRATMRYILKYVLKPEPDREEEAKTANRMPISPEGPKKDLTKKDSSNSFFKQ